MSENKINGPEDAVVNGIKTLPWKNRHSYEMLSRTLPGPDGTKFMDDRETGVFAKPFAEEKKRIRNNRATALPLVMSKWYASCIILSGKRYRT